jgi:outer membrane receptor for ferrienterochelin and colicin
VRFISSFLGRTTLCVAAAFVAMAAATQADAQTGKLTGVVTDAASGAPIEGVQVVLQGTGYGNLTSANGRFFIIAIPPGTYTVQARRIGYQTQQTQVQILIDVTREQNFALSTATQQIQDVQIVASQDNLIGDLTSSGTSTQITTAELEALPVRSVQEALTLQSGFQEIPIVSTDLTSFTSSRRNASSPIIIRGGRGGETLQLIDGIPVNNFLFGGTSLDITSKAVENVATFRGGLEPQYGNALSGVVSIATKEGGTNLAGSIEYETSRLGGAFGNTSDELRGFDFVDGYLSGPVPATQEKLRFVLAGRVQNEALRVLQFDDLIFNPFQVDTLSRGQDVQDILPGWRAMGFQQQRDMFGKLTYLFTPTMKLSAGIIDYERQRMSVPFDWMFTGFNMAEACVNAYQGRYGSAIDVADVCDTYYGYDYTASNGRVADGTLAGYEFTNPAVITQRRRLYTGKFEQTINRFNYRLVAGFFDQSRETCATYFSGICIGERIADTNFSGRFVTAGVTSQSLTPTEGTDQIAGNDDMQTVLFRADAQLQATDHHNLAAGVFYQGHDIKFREVRDIGLNNIFLQPSDFEAKPWDAALYIQDRIEYDFLTVRIGARYDYGRASGTFLQSALDPTNGTTITEVCNNPARFGLPTSFATFTDSVGRNFTGLAACLNPEARSKTDSAVAIAFADDMGPAKARTAFSPRLGINFPVTERSSAFFNFGVYYQNPLYVNLYQGTGIGTAAEGTVTAPAFRNEEPVGNPQLRAEQTTSYEVGYLAEFGSNFGVQVVAFSKDQAGLTGIRQGGIREGTLAGVFDPGVTYGTNTPTYTVLVNQDYNTVRGLELELSRRLANYWSARVNYAFSQATTNAAPPDLENQQLAEGDVPSRNEIRSDADRRHSANAALTFRVREQLPDIPLAAILRNTTLGVTAQYSVGWPYTPQLTFTGASRDRLERDSGTGPSTFGINLQAQKNFNVSNVQYGLFMRVTNLLDRENCVQVFESTGNCQAGASAQARLAAGNFTGEGEQSTFFDRPQYVGQRRSFTAGVRVNF